VRKAIDARSLGGEHNLPLATPFGDNTVSVKTITSLRELPKLVPGKVQVQRAGDFYKARWPGKKNWVFGQTPDEAKKRLLGSQDMR